MSKVDLWIAQSESWRNFIDFRLSEEYIADYPFLKRPDDFYIEIFGKLFELLNSDDMFNRKAELLAIGKGLEIFSLKNTRNYFQGVDSSKNILFASGLYYLADFPASSYLLANFWSTKQYVSDIDKFILCFLKRNLNSPNKYITLLKNYLETGSRQILSDLRAKIKIDMQKSLDSNPIEYVSYKLADSLLIKFIQNNIWADLLKFSETNNDFWSDYVNLNLKKDPPIWEFFPSQRLALERQLLKENETVSLQMPTSAGKTAICELVIYHHFKKNPDKKILFLAPFRALACELKFSFQKRLSDLGIKSKTIYGGNIDSEEDKSAIEKVNVLIATPEKFVAIENTIPDIYKMFNTIICDEGHLLDDIQRGFGYELLLSRFKQVNENSKFVFLSAIIPNIDEINRWLGGNDHSLVQTEYRPTELNFSFLQKQRDSYSLDINPTKQWPQKYVLFNYLSKNELSFRDKDAKKGKITSNKLLAVATALKAMPNGVVALFSPSKSNNGLKGLGEEVIKLMESDSTLPKPLEYSNEIMVKNYSEYFSILFGEDYLLTKLVSYGVILHHGDIPQYVRELIEQLIRKDGVRLLLCTSTLAEGVNLPIKTIVIHTIKRFNPKTKKNDLSIHIRDIKNLVGRAGRAGKETSGLVIVTNPKEFSIFRKVIENIQPEPVNGHLYNIIKFISDRVKQKRLVLNGEFLDERSEKFQQLLDSIDIALIDLLAEEVDVNQLETLIDSLVKNTFAYHQSNSDEKVTLKTIINHREVKIKKYIENSEFRFIKKSGVTIRLYEELNKILNLNSPEDINPIWFTLTNPSSEEWLSYFIGEIIYPLSRVQFHLDEFNAHLTEKIDKDDLIKILMLWIKGATYREISEETNIEINLLVKLFSQFVEPIIQNISASTIELVNIKMEDKGLYISPVAKFWSEYLSNGVNTTLALDLVRVGFIERVGLIEMNKYLYDIKYEGIMKLKEYLVNHPSIVTHLKQKGIPILSLNFIIKLMDNLKEQNIL